jgi:acetamidase/formamidase
MATHYIEPERATLHGHFSRDLPPILTVDPGDTVVYRTLDASWAVEPRTSPKLEDWPRAFEPRDKHLDGGHALCGPVAIRGAEPGMTIAARFNTILPGSWGWTVAGGWDSEANRSLGVDTHGVLHLWTIDQEALTATNQHGHRVRLRPFMGVVGLAPGEPGTHDTGPPRWVGGNMDCRELVAGSTLYLPVAVPGGQFSVGDGHGAQGDGEVSGTSIECPMDRVEVTFELLPNEHNESPRANTPAGWITFGFHEDLNEATRFALCDMLDLMEAQYRISRPDALALASLVVDLHVTQIVNGVHGVHALLPHGAIGGIG